MAKGVRLLTVLNVTGLFHVTLNAVLLPVCGRGILGVRARGAACQTKQERFVLHKFQVVVARLVLVHETKREAATLGCKLYVSYFINEQETLFLFPRMASFCFGTLFISCARLFALYDPK